MYTHLGGGDMRAVYETQESPDPGIFVDRALEVIARGYTAIKVLITPPTESLNSIAAYKYAERMMEALCTAVGDDVDIMVDCHGRHSLGNAVEFCRVLAPFGPSSLKSQCPPRMWMSWRVLGT